MKKKIKAKRKSVLLAHRLRLSVPLHFHYLSSLVFIRGGLAARLPPGQTSIHAKCWLRLVVCAALQLTVGLTACEHHRAHIMKSAFHLAAAAAQDPGSCILQANPPDCVLSRPHTNSSCANLSNRRGGPADTVSFIAGQCNYAIPSQPTECGLISHYLFSN